MAGCLSTTSLSTDFSEDARSNVATLLKALQSVLEDDSFKINSSTATEARKAAVKLLDWCSNDANKQNVDVFTKTLFEALHRPIMAASKWSYNREILWRSYFLERSSEAFIKKWVIFLELAEVTPTPILYQHVTDLVFREMVHNHFVGSRSSSDESQPREVMQHEGSALRYAGGYVCRQLHKKIERGNHQFKEELVLCLMALVKDRSTDQECGNEEEWIKLMDRGGLWYLKHSLFISIEEETRESLKMLSHLTYNCKEKIIKAITNNENVLFYWLIATADFDIDDHEVHDTLLKMIVELYVTMRGFSYASSWMEKFKQSAKKSTQ